MKGHELANRFELAHSTVSIIWKDKAKYFKKVKNVLQLRMLTLATGKFSVKRTRNFQCKPLWIPVLRSLCQSSLVRKALISSQSTNFPESSPPPFARSLDFDNPDDPVAVPAPVFVQKPAPSPQSTNYVIGSN